MLKNFLAFVAVIGAASLVFGAALPVESDTPAEPELRCPVATDCPTGYTCCGLYDVKLGGICRKLEAGQYCIM
ncbi:hypothetical protein NMY22_g6142 [Coprinellus aureogranulatus]|nr:hypothetical protein NMY22_g6142 [Coprinellus aureogranulatus]